MEFPKDEPEKCDLKAPSKIPPVPKTQRQHKPVLSKPKEISPALISKIPKRDANKTTTTAASRLFSKLHKQVDPKKESKSMMSLSPPKSTRPSQALLSSRSHINTHRSVKSTEQTPRSQISTRSNDKVHNVAVKKNIVAFEGIKEKVRSIQTEFMRKWDVVKNDLPPGEGEYKLIGLVKENDGHLVTKDTQKIKIKCAQKTLDELKKNMQNYLNNNLNPFIDSLDKLKNPPGKIGDNSVKGFDSLTTAIEDVKKKLKSNNQTPLTDMLKQLESFEPCEKPIEPPANCLLESKVANLLKECDELRKSFDLSQKELTRIKKSAEDRVNSYKKDLEELDKKLNRKKVENDELKRKFDILEKDCSKDKANNKELQEKLHNMTSEVEDLKKKLKTTTQSNDARQAKNHELETKIKKMESDFKAFKDAEKHTIGDQVTKHVDEIRTLKENLIILKSTKEQLDKDVLTYKLEIEKNKDLANQLQRMKEQAKHVDSDNQILRQTLRDMENKIQVSESMASVSKDVYDELSKLKKSESINHQKIDLLEMELTKARFQNKKLEEKIVMDRKLLDVRSSLIESLQIKENTQKVHLKDLFAEVDERNNDIQMLKTELLTKTEEFQNLFATLSTKQLELTRQEHMIKLLQESNERAQTLRVKQEAKIARFEEEIAHLKQTITLYQDAVLPSNELRKNLLLAEATRENDLNDNLGYFIDERRRKRHIDINVKKYEK